MLQSRQLGCTCVTHQEDAMKQRSQPWFVPRTVGWGWQPANWRGTAFILTALAIVLLASLIVRPIWLASMMIGLILIVFVAFLRILGTNPGRAHR